MRKNVFGRQFSRDTNQRKSLFKSLISSLILQESIKTTLEKAKAIKGQVDKIVNYAKKEDMTFRVQLLQKSLGIDAVNKIIKDIAPRFKERNSGYTRLTKLGRRFSDNAAMVLMEWVVKKEVNDKGLMIKDKKELPAGKEEKKETKKEIKEKKEKRKVAKK